MENLMNQKAWNQIAEVELIYRSKVKASERPKIISSNDAAAILRIAWNENKIDYIEQFKVVLLNRSNKVLGIFDVSSGGVTGTVADPRVIFTAALKANATAIVISHNHPSGNLEPSKNDLDLTQKIKNGGQILDIRVLDHIIITSEGYYSFADNGII